MRSSHSIILSLQKLTSFKSNVDKAELLIQDNFDNCGAKLRNLKSGNYATDTSLVH